MSSKYTCVVCDKKLAKRESLEYHLNIHKGFYAFKCDHCDKMFYTKSGFQKHINKVHRKLPASDVMINGVDNKDGQGSTDYAGHDIPLPKNFGHVNDMRQSSFNGNNAKRGISGIDSERDFNGNDPKRDSNKKNPKRDFNGNNPKRGFNRIDPKRDFNENDPKRGFSGIDPKRDFSGNETSALAHLREQDTETKEHFKESETLTQDIKEYDLERNFNGNDTLKEESFTGHNPHRQEDFSGSDPSTRGNLNGHDKPTEKTIYGHDVQSEGNLSVLNTPFIQRNSNRNEGENFKSSYVSSQKSFKCGECGRNYLLKKSLLRHMKVHVGKPNVPKDGFEFVKSASCQKDMVQNNLNVTMSPLCVNAEVNHTSWSCDICDATFSSKNERHAHYRTHFTNKDKLFSCTKCDKEYMHSWSLTRHKKRVHLKQASLSREQCVQTLTSEKRIKSHCKTFTRIHKKVFRCKECGKVYVSQKDLLRHQKMHRKPFFYQCGICYKSFASENSLNGHFSVHRGRKKDSLESTQQRRQINVTHTQPAPCDTNPGKVDTDCKSSSLQSRPLPKCAA